MKIVVDQIYLKKVYRPWKSHKQLKKDFVQSSLMLRLKKSPWPMGEKAPYNPSLMRRVEKSLLKKVTGPLGEKVTAFFGVLGDGKTAVIEMAAASGLHLVPMEKRNPLLTTTRGTGELILAALDEGVDHLIIGIGGSATNDGGSGMAQALGARLLDKDRNEIAPGGGSLDKLANIDISELDARLQNVKIEVACDVDNPLIGQDGASHVFGPQKGATPEMVEQLDQNLAHYATILARDLGKDVAHIPGAGAAGGLGAGLLAFLDAELKSGIDIVIAATDLEEKIKDADLVITGEGKIDSQTIHGKTPIGVAKTAKKFNIPVIAICGSIADDADVVHDHGIDVLFSSLMRITTLEEALESGASNVEKTARNIAALYKLAIGK